MMARAGRGWQIDWAGPHGTAWGTFNACLTTVTLAWVGHLVEVWWPAPPIYIVLAAFVVTALGVLAVLLRAALAGRRRPAATVLYQVCCWVGAGCWAMVMVASPHWSWRWGLIRVGVLVAMAVVAGIAAALAAADPPNPDGPPTPSLAQSAAVPARRDPEMAVRNAIAIEQEQRLARVVGGEGWRVPNIEHWKRGNGYTFEAVAPVGYSWRSVANKVDDFAADMDLPFGGGITVSMGISRRVALVEVTTIDVLAADYPYPVARPVHSINDDLVVGIRDDGSTIGPNLRPNSMVIAGEAGSGKSNGAHCYTAEIVTTNDALPWGWDLTGKLFTAWIDPYLRGKVDTPAFDWCARDGQELLWMTRAAVRIGLVRPQAYAQLMLDRDDDKVPVSLHLPEVLVIGDEIARVTGAISDHPQAKENLRLITFEHRAAAVRAAFFALRGTDDVITQDIQSQCQVKGVMKVGSKAEANWVFGSYVMGPEDTPYPGCGGLSLSSGELPIRLKYFRMKPSQIREIALHSAPRRPELDEVSRLAANGRNPDGSPMDDLLPGELDCYDTRWARYRTKYGQGAASVAPAAPIPAQAAGGAGPASATAQAVADLNRTMADLEAAAVKARAAQVDDDEQPDRERAKLSDRDRDEFARMMEAEGFGSDWTWSDEPESAPQPSDERVLLELIEKAGSQGARPQDLLPLLAGRGIAIHKDTLYVRLNDLRDRGLVYRPRHGRWARRQP